jgi:hypothetical protein
MENRCKWKHHRIFSDDVVIDGKTLKKGNTLCLLFQVFRVGKWFIQQPTTGNLAEFNEANVALRTTVKEEALPKSVDTLPLDLVR